MSFFGLGFLEILVIGVLALIFIGPEKLPGVIRDLMGFYRQIRSLGSEWREQVEKEIGADIRSLTSDVNQGLEAFGRSIEREVQDVEGEIRAAQDAALNPAPSATAVEAPPSEFAALPPPEKAVDEDDEDRPKSLDYLPGR